MTGPLRSVWPGPLDGLMSLRNRLVLRRIARLAEARHRVATSSPHGDAIGGG